MRDCLRGRPLRVHRVDGYRAAFDVEKLQKCPHRRDLVGLAVNLNLSECQAGTSGEGVDHM